MSSKQLLSWSDEFGDYFLSDSDTDGDGDGDDGDARNSSTSSSNSLAVPTAKDVPKSPRSPRVHRPTGYQHVKRKLVDSGGGSTSSIASSSDSHPNPTIVVSPSPTATTQDDHPSASAATPMKPSSVTVTETLQYLEMDESTDSMHSNGYLGYDKRLSASGYATYSDSSNQFFNNSANQQQSRLSSSSSSSSSPSDGYELPRRASISSSTSSTGTASSHKSKHQRSPATGVVESFGSRPKRQLQSLASVRRVGDRDWSSEWRAVLGEPVKRRGQLMRDLMASFVSESERITQTVVRERHKPVSERTLQPISGGIAGGEKYYANGIFAKYAVDNYGLFGGNDHNAMKAAAHEKHGLESLMGIGMVCRSIAFLSS